MAYRKCQSVLGVIRLSIPRTVQQTNIHPAICHACCCSPLCLDVGARSDVVFAGEDKLVVQDPLRLVVETRARVELNHLHKTWEIDATVWRVPDLYLVVFHCEIMSASFQMTNL